jgi:hypothetical protein
MAFADFAEYQARCAAPHQQYTILKGNLSATNTARPTSMWTATGIPGAGATPSTAAVPSRTITGAIGQVNPAVADALRIVQAEQRSTVSGGLWMICDRLSHQGGLSGTTTTAQTTNLPTAALTRYTDGVGVMAALEIYSAVGSTATTVVCSYTNTDPTSGQLTQPMVFGGTNDLAAGRMILFNLASGDKGVRAVANVDLVASTTTAGNFGVTLFRPLLMMPSGSEPAGAWWNMIGGGAHIPQVLTDACLFLVFVCQGTGGTGIHAFRVDLGED